MAEWWQTREGASTVARFAQFMERVHDGFESVVKHLDRVATAMESKAAVEEMEDEPAPNVLFATSTKVMYVGGIWNETVPGHFHFVPKHGIYLNGVQVHLEAIEVDEGTNGVQKVKHHLNEKEYEALLEFCNGTPDTLPIVGNAGGRFRTVVPFVVSGKR